MAVIKKKGSKGLPAVSTASLPDIIFTLLFFFMVAAKVKEVTKVKTSTPQAVNTKKLTAKDKKVSMHVGTPVTAYQGIYGDQPRIQLEGKVVDGIEDIQEWVLREKQKVDRERRNDFLVALKADSSVPYSLIADIKLELRKADALNLMYDSKFKTYQ